MSLPSTMQAAQVKEAGKLEMVQVPVPKPGPRQVLLKVLACGVCKSDELVFHNVFHSLPRIPGHEVIGEVVELGSEVTRWKKGERLGAGWFGGRCDQCRSCARGDFVTCAKGEITGVTHDGGYAEYFVQPEEALARIPEELSDEEAAPLLCAGITVYNSLRHAGSLPGDIVAVQGLGGLGHLAVQYSVKMGFKTVVLGRGPEKKKIATELGAHLYIDTNNRSDPGYEELKKAGGINTILSTAPASALDGLVGLLAVDGTLVVVGVSNEAIPGITPLDLITKRRRVIGWPSGHAGDWEDALNFHVLSKVKTHVEVFPLENAQDAFKAMQENKVLRAVIVPRRK
eukprot:TRINITY_DN16397_c0_g1_i1.p1 TRINITY_DN16397_c0_g1~~TRINITY_DN16397_c0_g1_i1.p1  ORF type:complete len:342 (+),score=95.13 TRINITY_DN16397_c0_g1_i1:74-1099(+)